MRIPLLKGREFDEHDDANSRNVIIIDETLARRFWPEKDPIGEHIRIDDASPAPPREVEVVGVVHDVKHNNLLDEPTPTVYAPIFQTPQGTLPFLANNMNLVVRTSNDPLRAAAVIRQEVLNADLDIAASNIRTMKQYLATAIATRRFNLILVTLFAAVALLLAATGIYAVVSYSITQRTREIGIRMALGAQSSDILKMIIAQGLKMTVAGVIIGTVGSLLLTRTLSSLLFDVTATDPGTYILMSLLLLGVASLACIVPAKRAIRIDPLVAFRSE